MTRKTRWRHGDRCVHALLDNEGRGINIKTVRRIRKALGRQPRHKTPGRRVKAMLRNDRAVAVGPDDVRAMDVVHDQRTTGKTLRELTVVDTVSRCVPVLDVRCNGRGGDGDHVEEGVATLDRVCRVTGCPKTNRVNQGSAFVSRDMDLWACQDRVLRACQRGVTLEVSCPGKSANNAFIKAVNDGFRAQCLNMHQVLTLADTAENSKSWRRDQNEDRPYSTIGNKVPIMPTQSGGVTSPSS